MRHATLLKRDKENGEVILILERLEFQLVAEAVEAFAKANPRRKTVTLLNTKIGEVEAF